MGVLNRFRRKITAKYIKTVGKDETINGETVNVLLRDKDNKIILALTTGTITNLNSQSDFQKGAMVIKTNVASGTAAIYQNTGTAASSNFTLM